MLGILKVAQRMIAAGLDEKEVAEGLINFLKNKYNIVDDVTPTRLVCRNTFQHTMPEFSLKDEPWHNK